MRYRQNGWVPAYVCLIAALWVTVGTAEQIKDGEWPSYTRDQMGSRYSPLDQVNRDNVGDLVRTWTYRTGDIAKQKAHYFECTPLVVHDTLFVITTFSRLVALDPTTGQEKWTFAPDPPLKHSETGAGGLASRGVAYWKSGDKERIFLPVRDGRLYSIDLEARRPDPQFGEGGIVHMRKGYPGDGRYIFLSAPPVVFDDLVIPSFGVNDAWSKHPSVPLRAFDAHTGQEVWAFHTIPRPGDVGNETWENDSWKDRGGANVWSVMTVDPERGMLFLAVSTPNYDFYGGDRPGSNLFTDSVVALNARTGKYLWHFQTVHHDLWDYDLAAHPNLVTVTHEGRRIPAVAQVGKTGYVYLLHRETGEPLFPIREEPFPTNGVPGECVSPTQPIPSKPPALVRTRMTERDVFAPDRQTREQNLDRFAGLRSEGIFTPPSLEGTIVFPGLHGGMNWSGACTDPDGMLYTNTTELAFVIRLEESEDGPFRYRVTGNIFTQEENGYPLNSPPWGQLVKVDLNAGEILWSEPLGEFRALTRKGIPPTGQENFGGAIVTAGGLVFIASSMDGKIRAFDSQTGKVLWQDQMEVAGYAAPVTYLGSDGRQYVAICAGGGCKPSTKVGDYVIGFALDR